MKKPKKNAAGALVGEAHVTRVGVFPYRRADGSIRYEFRSPEEVFRADSLAAFNLTPMTLDHPEEGHVSTKTARELQVGSVANARRDGEKILVDYAVTVNDAISAIENGVQELSVGYDCDYVAGAGEWNGQRYDGRQTNIVPNHVAIVKKGRAGPDCGIRLDADDGIEIEVNTTERNDHMEYVIIDGLRIPLSGNQTALQNAIDGIVKSRNDANDLVAAEKKRTADAVAATAAEKKRADAAEALSTDEALAKRVAERSDLIATAREFIDDAKTLKRLDSMTDLEIKVAVIKLVDDEVKLDGKSADYVTGRYDSAVEALSEDDGDDDDDFDDRRNDGDDDDFDDDEDDDRDDDRDDRRSRSDRRSRNDRDLDPRDKMIKRLHAQARKPLND